MKSKSLATTYLCTFLFLILTTTSAEAFGFGLQADDTEAKALGGAYTARTKGASAIYYNPAGLIGDSTFSVRSSVYWRNYDVTVGPAESSDDAILHGTLAFSMKFSDRLAVGVGYLPVFENSLNVERMDLITNSAFDTDFTVDMIRSAASFKLNDKLSVGLGIDYYDASFSFENYFRWTTQNIADSTSIAINPTLDELSDSTFGFSFGFLGELGDGWSVGAMYRHEAELELTGDAEYSSDIDRATTFVIDEPALGGVVDPRGPLREQLPINGTATMMMTIPAEAAFGLYYHGNDTFSASADVRWTKWSSMEDSKVIVNTGMEYRFSEAWEDVVSLHFGADYNLTEKITILGGYAYVPSPITEESVPQYYPYADRQDISVGSRFHFDAIDPETDAITGSFSFDFALVFSQYDDLEAPNMSSNYPNLELPFISVTPSFRNAVISTESMTFLFGITAEFN